MLASSRLGHPPKYEIRIRRAAVSLDPRGFLFVGLGRQNEYVHARLDN